MLNVSLRVCCSTSLPLRSVMPEEMLRVMAARCEFELEDGVWYLLDGPPELLQSHPSSVLSCRFGLAVDDMLKLLQPLGIIDFRTARDVSWTANMKVPTFRPEQNERNVPPYGRLRYIQYMQHMQHTRHDHERTHI